MRKLKGLVYVLNFRLQTVVHS